MVGKIFTAFLVGWTMFVIVPMAIWLDYQLARREGGSGKRFWLRIFNLRRWFRRRMGPLTSEEQAVFKALAVLMTISYLYFLLFAMAADCFLSPTA